MVSQLIFGTWALGGDHWGPIELDRARRVLRAAWNGGFRRFDTAESYGNGRVEQLIAQVFRSVIRSDRDSIAIDTKSVVRDPSSQRKHLERSLRRCDCGYFNRYYIHWPRRGLSLPRAIEELDYARRRGLIREIGLSNVTVPEYEAAASVAPIDAVQFGYSVFWRVPERQRLTDLAGTRRVAYSPLASGLLARPFPAVPTWAEGDHRRFTPLFSAPLWSIVHTAHREYFDRCIKAGVDPIAVAIAWLFLRSGGVDTAVVGGRSEEHVARLTDTVAGIPEKANAASWQTLLDDVTKISDRLNARMPTLPNMFGYTPRPCRNYRL